MIRLFASDLDKTKITINPALHKDHLIRCTDDLINSLNKALLTENDANYRVASNLQKLCSAVTPDKLN